MTDNEIIKALELHAMDDDNTCDDCDYRACGCSYTLCKDAIDLINRQQAEIEYFKKEHIEIDNFARNICKERLLQGKAIADFDSLRKYVESQKAEAIKEFAEKIKETTEFQYEYFLCNIIDDLVKEMVGDI